MADNVQITAGSGTSIATDDVFGVHYQRVKLDLGVDGVSSPLVRGQQTKANSLPVTLASDTGPLPVSLAVNLNPTQDAVAAVIRADRVVSGVSIYTVQHAAINVSSSGDTTLVAAGGPIRVLGVTLIAGGSVNVTFKAGATAITGPMPLVANSGFSAHNPAGGLFKTGTSQALVINLSAAVQVSGFMSYIEEGGEP